MGADGAVGRASLEELTSAIEAIDVSAVGIDRMLDLVAALTLHLRRRADSSDAERLAQGIGQSIEVVGELLTRLRCEVVRAQLELGELGERPASPRPQRRGS